MKAKLLLWGGAGIVLLILSIVVSMSFGSAMIPFAEVWSIMWHSFCITSLASGKAAPHPLLISPSSWTCDCRGSCLPFWSALPYRLQGPAFKACCAIRWPIRIRSVWRRCVFRRGILDSFGLHYYLFGQWTVPVVAFMTGMLSLLIVMRLASMNGKFRVETMILSGVVVQAFFGAVVSLFISMSDSVVNEIVFWLMGSLKLRDWSFSAVMVPYLLVGANVAAMALPDRSICFRSVNVRPRIWACDVERTKRSVLIICTLLSAAAVSVSGTIGFVGLVMPHLMRLLAGPDYRSVIPLSAIYGGIYVLWADTLARPLLAPTEMPLGVVTAFLGAPFFAWLLVRQKRKVAI